MNRYLEIANLTKAYPNPFGQDIAVVKDFNLILSEGEVLSVIGHSGCGKSTVLTMIAGLNEITSGSVIVAGKEVSGAGPDRAVVFQAPCLLPWMTSLENVMLGVRQVYPHGTPKERRQICEYYLNVVGLAETEGKPQLSVLPPLMSAAVMEPLPDALSCTVVFWQSALGASVSTTVTSRPSVNRCRATWFCPRRLQASRHA